MIANPENKRIKEQLDHMMEVLKNPFEEMYHWCKGEIYDLQGMETAIVAKEDLEKQVKKLQAKKQSA